MPLSQIGTVEKLPAKGKWVGNCRQMLISQIGTVAKLLAMAK